MSFLEGTGICPSPVVQEGVRGVVGRSVMMGGVELDSEQIRRSGRPGLWAHIQR